MSVILGADAATTTTGGAMSATTQAPASDMKPGVAKAPVDQYGFFFAAYGVVWVVLLLYVLYLASRVRALDTKK